MNRFRVSVHVIPREGILDPQGTAVANALHALGFNDVQAVRIGRHIEVDTSAQSPEHAREQVTSMCERLLANPVTEAYDIHAVTRL